jgi:hypothetical protein
MSGGSATDDATENRTFCFSTDLDPLLYRRAIDIVKLMADYNCTREELLAAAKNERKGFVYIDYLFNSPSFSRASQAESLGLKDGSSSLLRCFADI